MYGMTSLVCEGGAMLEWTRMTITGVLTCELRVCKGTGLVMAAGESARRVDV
jgi:hypothetical protein